MTKYQAWLLAAGCWLLTLALGIAAAATYDEYSRLSAGAEVTGVVTGLEPHASYTTVYVRYLREGAEAQTRIYPRGAEASAYTVGAPVPLLVSRAGTLRRDRLEEHRPSPLLPAGAALFFVLGALCARIPSAEAKRRAARTTPLEALVDGARRTRDVALAGVVMLLLAAAFFVVIAEKDTTATTGIMAGLYGLAGLCGVLASFLVARAWRMRDPRSNPLLTLLEQRPWELAWVYVQVVRSRYGVEVRTAFLWLADGSVETLRLVPEDVDVVLRELARLAPHARFGYDPQTEALYKQNPARWRPQPG